MKVYVALGNRFGEVGLFRDRGWEITTVLKDADLVVFTGGSDIQPKLYNEETHSSVYTAEERDALEVEQFHRARELKIPILGICRGAQLACVLLGGSLFQDAPHPGPTHMMELDDGRQLLTTSYHHQMMRPGEGAIIKAWTNNLANRHIYMPRIDAHYHPKAINIEVVEKEPEVVLYPESKVLCVQGHPEFMQHHPRLLPFRDYVFDLIHEHLVFPKPVVEAADGDGFAITTIPLAEA